MATVEGPPRTVARSGDGEDLGGCGHLLGALRDLRSLYVRDVAPGDVPAVRAVNSGLSPHSSYLRYFGIFACAGDGEIARILAVGSDRISVLGLVDGLPVALAELDGLDAPEGCEVALSVEDAYQGLGIGTLLLAELVRRAAARGVTRMRADLLHDNRVMLRLLQHSGLPLTLTLDRYAEHALLALPVDDLRGGAVLHSRIGAGVPGLAPRR